MKRSTCPSCGAPYNGKRCRRCCYEHFTEEIAHGNHAHRGESLVTDAPARKPASSCAKAPRKKHPLVRFLVLLTLIYSLMPMLRNWGLRLEAMENRPAAMMAAQPEPILQPENMVIFHQEDGITIFTTPEQFSDPNHFSLYVHNESAMKVTASAGEIQVNDIDLPHASLVCRAKPGEIGKGWLETDPVEWQAAGIQDIRTLSFTITVLRQDGRIGFETDEICIIAEGTDTPTEPFF